MDQLIAPRHMGATSRAPQNPQAGRTTPSSSDHSARTPSAEDFLGVSAVTVCLATIVALAAHAIGALIRHRREAAIPASQ